MEHLNFMGIDMSLRRRVSEELVDQGFIQNGRMHLKRIDAEFSYWVDTGPIGKREDVAPFLGIRHELIESLRSELLGQAKDDWVGSIGANVGYVLGEDYLWWESPADPAEVMGKLTTAFSALARFLSVNDLAAMWDIQGAKTPGWQYRYIVLCAIRGDLNMAIEGLGNAEAVFCKYNDSMCAKFRNFRERFFQKFSLSASVPPQTKPTL